MKKVWSDVQNTGLLVIWLLLYKVLYQEDLTFMSAHIKSVGEKRLNARLAEHFISFSQREFNKLNNT